MDAPPHFDGRTTKGLNTAGDSPKEGEGHVKTHPLPEVVAGFGFAFRLTHAKGMEHRSCHNGSDRTHPQVVAQSHLAKYAAWHD